MDHVVLGVRLMVSWNKTFAKGVTLALTGVCSPALTVGLSVAALGLLPACGAPGGDREGRALTAAADAQQVPRTGRCSDHGSVFAAAHCSPR